MERRVAICGGREAVADFVQGGQRIKGIKKVHSLYRYCVVFGDLCRLAKTSMGLYMPIGEKKLKDCAPVAVLYIVDTKENSVSHCLYVIY